MTADHAVDAESAPSSAGTDDASAWVAIGEIVAPFGRAGALKVRPLTDFPDRFARTATVYLGARHVPYAVTAARCQGQQIILALAGISSIGAAARLRGLRVAIPEAEITSLPANQFYLHDIIGLRVEHVNGQYLGAIADVVSSGGQDLYVVRNDERGTEVLLPAVRAFIRAVDLDARVMRVEPIAGLFDDQADEAR